MYDGIKKIVFYEEFQTIPQTKTPEHFQEKVSTPLHPGRKHCNRVLFVFLSATSDTNFRLKNNSYLPSNCIDYSTPPRTLSLYKYIHKARDSLS